MSGVKRLVQAETEGTKVPTNEDLKAKATCDDCGESKDK